MARKAKTPIRNHQMVPVSVIDHLLDQLVEGDLVEPFTTELEALNAIGYASGAVNSWRKWGKAPKRAQYALMGLLAEQQHKSNGSVPTPPEQQFTFDELTQIFTALLRDTVTIGPTKSRLQAKVATEMTRYMNGG